MKSYSRPCALLCVYVSSRYANCSHQTSIRSSLRQKFYVGLSKKISHSVSQTIHIFTTAWCDSELNRCNVLTEMHKVTVSS